MKIIYKNNDAREIPLYMSGTRIEIRNWLINNAVGTRKLFADINEHLTKEEEYDDGQGRRYDILDEELQ